MFQYEKQNKTQKKIIKKEEEEEEEGCDLYRPLDFKETSSMPRNQKKEEERTKIQLETERNREKTYPDSIPAKEGSGKSIFSFSWWTYDIWLKH